MSEADTILLLCSSDINKTYPKLQINTNYTPTVFDFYLSTAPSTATQPWKLVSPEMADKAYWFTFQVLNPIVGIIGILGSIASGIILKKDGLHQSSNILLFALAIADACCLFGAFNIGNILLRIPGRGIPGSFPAWKFSYTASYVAYIVFMICAFLSSIGSRVSTYITVLITVERFIAVFFPFRFPSIVTPGRVWLAIAMVTLLWLPWSCFSMTWFGFVYYLSSFDAFVGQYIPTKYYLDSSWIARDINTHFTQLIPLIIVTIGSVIISLKIGLTLRKRQKLMQSKSETRPSTSRTNRTLLMVCLVFSITRFSYYLQYLPWFGIDDSSEWINLSIVYALFRDILNYLNSAINFFIYVGINKKFRKTFKDLWHSTKLS